MPEIKEGSHGGAFIMSEAPGKRSRENVMVAGGMKANSVLGALGATQSDVYSAIDTAGAYAGAAGILLYATPEGDPVERAAIVRDAEVNGKAIRWVQSDIPEDQPSDEEIAAGVAALAAVGIIVR